ncbi:hypothetical protein BD324DRAFT_505671 [Kockovaella imperatae]|uniref:Uncharacterized protein n=1 Tax=Kockovaella imperatae TaxID=4999 RepID=A0A1Y1UHG2_9TREE|nr:hypothetical protein BD324DRAFT_505671 [Kockovaella imperatae]ORX36525.1 hypothetical protein BD324DRAFT_505671 [Kockovaella imperatae]
MAPFSPLPPCYPSHVSRPNQSFEPPSRPFAHIFGQTVPAPAGKRRRVAPSSPLILSHPCAPESKGWMVGLALICTLVVVWLVSLPNGEGFERSLEAHESERNGVISGPRRLLDELLNPDDGYDGHHAMIATLEKDKSDGFLPLEGDALNYTSNEAQDKRKITIGNGPEFQPLPFGMILMPSEPTDGSAVFEPDTMNGGPAELEDADAPKAQGLEHRWLELDLPTNDSPWMTERPMDVEETDDSPSSDSETGPTVNDTQGSSYPSLTESSTAVPIDKGSSEPTGTMETLDPVVVLALPGSLRRRSSPHAGRSRRRTGGNKRRAAKSSQAET